MTSSPKYSRANEEVERAVRTVKIQLRKNEDPYPALLAYRCTPLQNGFSPSELLMGRRLRTIVPAVPSVLKPNVRDTDRQRMQLREDEYRSKQQIYYDKRQQAPALPSLTTGERVWVRDQNPEGQILGATKQLRSCLVKTEMGTVRRKRSAIVSTSSQPTLPSNEPTMASRAQVLPVNQTPPKASSPVTEGQPAEPSTSATCGSTTVVPPQGSHPDTEHSATERVTRSGRVVRLPQWPPDL